MAAQNGNVDELWDRLSSLSGLAEWAGLVAKLREAWTSEWAVERFAAAIGAKRGVSGYAFQSVPLAIYAAVRHSVDFAAALEGCVACGGDTDTVGAMAGALVGARVGNEGIPRAWRDGIFEYPCSVDLLTRVAASLSGQLATGVVAGPVVMAWPFTPLRNLFFLVVVLVHGFRRLLPPY
jgi:hypothetical protein